jgi:hypothetical protein
MKNGKKIIRDAGELAHQFEKSTLSQSGFQLRVNPERGVEASIDGRSRTFAPTYILRPAIPTLRGLLSRRGKGAFPPILITPHLTERVLEFCREYGLSAVDLSGTVFLRAKGLLIDCAGTRASTFRPDNTPRNVFVGKSLRLVRSLLTDRDRAWSQDELIERTKVSAGLASRIVNHLIDEGFIEKTSARIFCLGEPLALLSAWANADRFERRTRTLRFSAFGADQLELARKIQNAAREAGLRIAFTQWTAASLRHAYTEPVIVSAYLERPLPKGLLESTGLRPVEDGGVVWLHIPNDEGVFLETQKVSGLTLASDAQIYLDLLRTGLRGPEQAEALRNWEGFCRP